MGGTCSVSGTNETLTKKALTKNLNKKDHLGDVASEGKMDRVMVMGSIKSIGFLD
jgi:hypothetical protein